MSSIHTIWFLPKNLHVSEERSSLLSPRVLYISPQSCLLFISSLEQPLSFLSIGCLERKWSHSVMFDSTTPWTVVYQVPLSMGFFQARILEWVVIFSSRGSSWPRDQTRISCVSFLGRQILNHWATREAPVLWVATSNPLVCVWDKKILAFSVGEVSPIWKSIQIVVWL